MRNVALAGVAPGPEMAAGMPGDRELPGTGRPPGIEGADGMVAVFGRTLGIMFVGWVGN